MKLHSEKTVTTKTTDIGPLVNDMRLSRLSHPRATLVAMVLLASVFLLFGMFAAAGEPAATPAPNTLDGAILLIGDWVLGGSAMGTG